MPVPLVCFPCRVHIACIVPQCLCLLSVSPVVFTLPASYLNACASCLFPLSCSHCLHRTSMPVPLVCFPCRVHIACIVPQCLCLLSVSPVVFTLPASYLNACASCLFPLSCSHCLHRTSMPVPLVCFPCRVHIACIVPQCLCLLSVSPVVFTLPASYLNACASCLFPLSCSHCLHRTSMPVPLVCFPCRVHIACIVPQCLCLLSVSPVVFTLPASYLNACASCLFPLSCSHCLHRTSMPVPLVCFPCRVHIACIVPQCLCLLSVSPVVFTLPASYLNACASCLFPLSCSHCLHRTSMPVPLVCFPCRVHIACIVPQCLCLLSVSPVVFTLPASYLNACASCLFPLSCSHCLHRTSMPVPLVCFPCRVHIACIVPQCLCLLSVSPVVFTLPASYLNACASCLFPLSCSHCLHRTSMPVPLVCFPCRVHIACIVPQCLCLLSVSPVVFTLPASYLNACASCLFPLSCSHCLHRTSMPVPLVCFPCRVHIACIVPQCLCLLSVSPVVFTLPASYLNACASCLFPLSCSHCLHRTSMPVPLVCFPCRVHIACIVPQCLCLLSVSPVVFTLPASYLNACASCLFPLSCSHCLHRTSMPVPLVCFPCRVHIACIVPQCLCLLSVSPVVFTLPASYLNACASCLFPLSCSHCLHRTSMPVPLVCFPCRVHIACIVPQCLCLLSVSPVVFTLPASYLNACASCLFPLSCSHCLHRTSMPVPLVCFPCRVHIACIVPQCLCLLSVSPVVFTLPASYLNACASCLFPLSCSHCLHRTSMPVPLVCFPCRVHIACIVPQCLCLLSVSPVVFTLPASYLNACASCLFPLSCSHCLHRTSMPVPLVCFPCRVHIACIVPQCLCLLSVSPVVFTLPASYLNACASCLFPLSCSHCLHRTSMPVPLVCFPCRVHIACIVPQCLCLLSVSPVVFTLPASYLNACASCLFPLSCSHCLHRTSMPVPLVCFPCRVHIACIVPQCLCLLSVSPVVFTLPASYLNACASCLFPLSCSHCLHRTSMPVPLVCFPCRVHIACIVPQCLCLLSVSPVVFTLPASYLNACASCLFPLSCSHCLHRTSMPVPLVCFPCRVHIACIVPQCLCLLSVSPVVFTLPASYLNACASCLFPLSCSHCLHRTSMPVPLVCFPCRVHIACIVPQCLCLLSVSPVVFTLPASYLNACASCLFPLSCSHCLHRTSMPVPLVCFPCRVHIACIVPQCLCLLSVSPVVFTLPASYLNACASCLFPLSCSHCLHRTSMPVPLVCFPCRVHIACIVPQCLCLLSVSPVVFTLPASYLNACASCLFPLSCSHCLHRTSMPVPLVCFPCRVHIACIVPQCLCLLSVSPVVFTLPASYLNACASCLFPLSCSHCLHRTSMPVPLVCFPCRVHIACIVPQCLCLLSVSPVVFTLPASYLNACASCLFPLSCSHCLHRTSMPVPLVCFPCRVHIACIVPQCLCLLSVSPVVFTLPASYLNACASCLFPLSCSHCLHRTSMPVPLVCFPCRVHIACIVPQCLCLLSVSPVVFTLPASYLNACASCLFPLSCSHCLHRTSMPVPLVCFPCRVHIACIVPQCLCLLSVSPVVFTLPASYLNACASCLFPLSCSHCLHRTSMPVPLVCFPCRVHIACIVPQCLCLLSVSPVVFTLPASYLNACASCLFPLSCSHCLHRTSMPVPLVCFPCRVHIACIVPQCLCLLSVSPVVFTLPASYLNACASCLFPLSCSHCLHRTSMPVPLVCFPCRVHIACIVPQCLCLLSVSPVVFTLPASYLNACASCLFPLSCSHCLHRTSMPVPLVCFPCRVHIACIVPQCLCLLSVSPVVFTLPASYLNACASCLFPLSCSHCLHRTSMPVPLVCFPCRVHIACIVPQCLCLLSVSPVVFTLPASYLNACASCLFPLSCSHCLHRTSMPVPLVCFPCRVHIACIVPQCLCLLSVSPVVFTLPASYLNACASCLFPLSCSHCLHRTSMPVPLVCFPCRVHIACIVPQCLCLLSVSPVVFTLPASYLNACASCLFPLSCSHCLHRTSMPVPLVCFPCRVHIACIVPQCLCLLSVSPVVFTLPASYLNACASCLFPLSCSHCLHRTSMPVPLVCFPCRVHIACIVPQCLCLLSVSPVVFTLPASYLNACASCLFPLSCSHCLHRTSMPVPLVCFPCRVHIACIVPQCLCLLSVSPVVFTLPASYLNACASCLFPLSCSHCLHRTSMPVPLVCFPCRVHIACIVPQCLCLLSVSPVVFTLPASYLNACASCLFPLSCSHCLHRTSMPVPLVCFPCRVHIACIVPQCLCLLSVSPVVFTLPASYLNACASCLFPLSCSHCLHRTSMPVPLVCFPCRVHIACIVPQCLCLLSVSPVVFTLPASYLNACASCLFPLSCSHCLHRTSMPVPLVCFPCRVHIACIVPQCLCLLSVSPVVFTLPASYLNACASCLFPLSCSHCLHRTSMPVPLVCFPCRVHIACIVPQCLCLLSVSPVVFTLPASYLNACASCLFPLSCSHCLHRTSMPVPLVCFPCRVHIACIVPQCLCLLSVSPVVFTLPASYLNACASCLFPLSCSHCLHRTSMPVPLVCFPCRVHIACIVPQCLCLLSVSPVVFTLPASYLNACASCLFPLSCSHCLHRTSMPVPLVCFPCRVHIACIVPQCLCLLSVSPVVFTLPASYLNACASCLFPLSCSHCLHRTSMPVPLVCFPCRVHIACIVPQCLCLLSVSPVVFTLPASYLNACASCLFPLSCSQKDLIVLHHYQKVFAVDALNSSHPLSLDEEEISTPLQIGNLFDSITYSKGAAVLRMLSGFLTENLFVGGLKTYLEQYKYNTTVYQDLWDHLQQAVNKQKNITLPDSVENIMNRWVLQMGFPVVTINTTTGTMTQKHFLLDPGAEVTRSSQFNYTWFVPVSWMKSGILQTDFWLLNTSEMNTTVKSNSTDWVLANINCTGYYRVNYDTENWNRLLQQLQDNFTKIPVINRAQLIDDAFNLARAGYIPTTLALNTTKYLSKDTEYMPWESAIDNLGYFSLMFDRTEVNGPMQTYLRKQVTPLFDYFENITANWTEVPSGHTDQYNEVTAIEVACENGLKKCQELASSLYREWMDNPSINPIHPNLKTTIYCNAIAAGGVEEWDFAWERFQNAIITTEADKLRYGLSCSKHIWILNRYLKYTLDPEKIRKMDSIPTINYISRNVVGQSLVWDFIQAYSTTICSGSSPMDSLLEGVTQRFSTELELKQVTLLRCDLSGYCAKLTSPLFERRL
ncbi:UNVERIFIED_CONTAM: hypothetical protein FKN15_047876 [Acipenser sinensis]